MRFTKSSFLFLALLAACGVSRADFKYTQQSKITGGSIVSMTKTLGVFSKNARQLTDPQVSTMSLKGNRLRQEHSDGLVEIIDLDGRRFIRIDPAKKTYSTMTFEEFKAALERAQARAKEEQAKAMAKHPEAADYKIVPKMQFQETGATRTILDLPTKEVKWRMDMEIQSNDPKAQQQMQSATMSMNSDSWLASSVPGYDELRQFYVRMAKELDWLPGTMGNVMGMNSQMGQAMEEFRKNSIKLQGMPLLQNVSFGMAGVPQNTGAAAQPQQPAPQQSQTQDQASTPTTPKEAISKSLGGVFGGFGKKKKQQEQQPQPAQPSGSAANPSPGNSQPASASNSMMDMTIEVTSFSSAAVDKSLFDVPAGYTQVQQDPDQPFSTGRH
jgi:hypothetical protein